MELGQYHTKFSGLTRGSKSPYMVAAKIYKTIKNTQCFKKRSIEEPTTSAPILFSIAFCANEKAFGKARD